MIRRRASVLNMTSYCHLVSVVDVCHPIIIYEFIKLYVYTLSITSMHVKQYIYSNRHSVQLNIASLDDPKKWWLNLLLNVVVYTTLQTLRRGEREEKGEKYGGWFADIFVAVV